MQKIKINPKYPDNPLIINKTEYNSENKNNEKSEYDKIYPIASLSKSFAGITCALMAVDEIFDKDRLNITLEKLLNEIARKKNFKNSKVTKEIEKYLELLKRKNILNVTIKQILTHSSGIHDSWKNKAFVEFFERVLTGEKIPFFDYLNSEIFLGKGNKRKKAGYFYYNSDMYGLLEEVLNFVSEDQSFLKECQKRIITKLGLSKTKTLRKLNKEERKTLGYSLILPNDSVEGYLHKDKELIILRADETNPTGEVPNFAGGFCSTINDLKIYIRELGKLYAGLPNKISNNKITSEIQKMFWSDLVEWKEWGAESYGYGIEVYINDKNELTFRHYGGFCSNNLSFIESSFLLKDKIGIYDISKAKKMGKKIEYLKKVTVKCSLSLMDGYAASIRNRILKNICQSLNVTIKKLKKEKQDKFKEKLEKQIEMKMFKEYNTKEGLFDSENFWKENSTMKEINLFIKKITDLCQVNKTTTQFPPSPSS